MSKKATPEQADKYEKIGQPMIQYLMMLRPSDAMNVLVLVTATLALSAQLKGDATPLDLAEEMAEAVRNTIKEEMAFQEKEKREAATAQLTEVEQLNAVFGEVKQMPEQSGVKPTRKVP